MTNNFLAPVIDASVVSNNLAGTDQQTVMDLSGDIASYVNGIIYEGEIATVTKGHIHVDLTIELQRANGAVAPPTLVVAQVDHTGAWTSQAFAPANIGTFENQVNLCVAGQQVIAIKSIKQISCRQLSNFVESSNNITQWHYNIVIPLTQFSSNEHKPSDEQICTRIVAMVTRGTTTNQFAVRGITTKNLTIKMRRLNKNDLS